MYIELGFETFFHKGKKIKYHNFSPNQFIKKTFKINIFVYKILTS